MRKEAHLLGASYLVGGERLAHRINTFVKGWGGAYSQVRLWSMALCHLEPRYTAANDPCKAIKTFHIMEKFRLSPDQEAFYTLLTALCKHGNVEDAEELMFQNKKLFPMETEGFNIILNGWGWIPGLEVYNSLIYVLTHENCLTEALKILGKIKEMGLQLDSASYNCMIRPLCKAKKLEEARTILAAMIGENLAGFGPNGDTFLLILDNLFKLDQPENALKIWVEMKQFDVVPGSEHYKLKKLLKDPVEGDSGEREGWMRQGKTDVRLHHGKSSMMRWKRLGNQSRKRPPLVKSNLKL
ncbi:Pentatricopeptide repeat-containing protein, mitochondrial [Vitis vinifera]|uniref:Pentatricopeptide repeat-containing protein, mitochondrial n=1 Tax=Vitis vinifera TaxID=29760 RepID=A0A438EN74_VITVI|nr:Pentatricopeptide repeat-containing protein, mitochondrial [Vitis vinifera]